MVASPSGQNPLNAMNSIISTAGGTQSALALPAGANLVKASPGRIIRISVNTVGTAGTLAVNDCATTAAVAASNLVWEGVDTQAIGGAPITLEFPCLVGIVVTVPTGGVVSVSFV
jgi:hypothetical protein